MSHPPETIRRLTHALLNPERASAALEALRGCPDQAAVEGLVELVYKPHSAWLGSAAVAALDGRDEPIVFDALRAALESPHTVLRLAAVQSIRQRGAAGFGEELAAILLRDESWLARRAALAALAEGPEPDRERIFDAATDPHWRVRHALINVLLGWGETDAARRVIDERLAALRGGRAEGVREYLRYRWSGADPTSFPAPDEPFRICPVWDWDSAVLARTLERMDEPARQAALGMMPFLLGHPDPRVRPPAAEALRDQGEVPHLAEVLALLDEPRNATVEPVGKLFAGLDHDRTEAVARFVFALPNPSPAQLAWALDQVGTVLPAQELGEPLAHLLDRASEQPPEVRRALARLAGRWERPDSESRLRTFLADPDPLTQLEVLRGLSGKGAARLDPDTLRRLAASAHPLVRSEAGRAAATLGDRELLEALASDADARVRLAVAESGAARERLRSDPQPYVRAAALTPEAAAELVADPERETSWHVLARAARLARTPLWKLEPQETWQPVPAPTLAPEPLEPRFVAPESPRVLGPGLGVSPLGISGHYGLPVEGFARAVEAGVNLMFWEPNYQTLTDFSGRLSPSGRRAIHFVAGTFEADGKRIRRDAERAIKTLRAERLGLFLVFWVQSWARITPDVREALQRLKDEGKVACFGLSTHVRPLAVEAMEAGWNPVMVRHSAAHRGAEERIFPKAVDLGASLLTFNNTCYGRLLRPFGDAPPPTAADCYRFAMEQPAVRACWSAPTTLDQLEENLSALRDPVLPEERRRALLAHGAALYREETIFRRLVRVL